MDPFITQCPKCETAFRVTPAQLEMAQGSVRCGSCMNIFIAKENRHLEKSAPQPAQHSAQQWQAKDSVGQFVEEQANSDPEELGEENTQEFEIDQHDFDTLDDLEADKNSEQEQWSSELDDQIAADATTTSSVGTSGHTDANSQTTEELLFDEEYGLDGPDDEPLAITTADTDNDQLASTADESATNKPTTDEPTSDFTAEEFTENKQEPYFNTNNQEAFATPEATFDTEAAAKEVLRDQILTNIEPAPVQLMVGDSPFEKAMKAIVNCAVLIAALGLGVQYAWLNMHELAMQPEYRPWYESGCKVFNCKLPPLRDFKKIRASNLVVRSHPKLKNILIIDVIMANQARYKQPYPILELIFSDVTGKVSASRRFLPEEYLYGELSGATTMRENQPVHLSLEIIDPGPEANSYSMRLHEIDYL